MLKTSALKTFLWWPIFIINKGDKPHYLVQIVIPPTNTVPQVLKNYPRLILNSYLILKTVWFKQKWAYIGKSVKN